MDSDDQGKMNYCGCFMILTSLLVIISFFSVNLSIILALISFGIIMVIVIVPYLIKQFTVDPATIERNRINNYVNSILSLPNYTIIKLLYKKVILFKSNRQKWDKERNEFINKLLKNHPIEQVCLDINNFNLNDLTNNIRRIFDERLSYIYNEMECLKVVFLLIEKHAKTLAHKKKILIRTDDYGKVLTQNWDSEKNYFIKTILFDEMEKADPDYWDIFEDNNYNLDDFASDISSLIDEVIIDNDITHEDYEIQSGEDFEFKCSEILSRLGWQTKLTKKSGDQGVDILAEKNNYSVAIQCKYYLSSVGNAAVQQVLAGKKYYNADYAAVVTNSTYTKSAIELANASNVILLTLNKLENLEEIIQDIKHN